MESWLIPAWIIIAPALAIIFGSSTKGHSAMGLGDPMLSEGERLGVTRDPVSARNVASSQSPVQRTAPTV
jgi:hypothetical protein